MWEYAPDMSQDDAHLQDRAKKAEKIIADPAAFKVCEGCDSIVRKRVASCPNCNGYRFEEETEAVVAQAKLLASRSQSSVSSEDLH